MTKFEKRDPPRTRSGSKRTRFDFSGMKPGDSVWYPVSQSNQINSAFAVYMMRGKFTTRKEVKDGVVGHRLYYLKKGD